MMIGKQACPPVSLLTALAFTLAVSAVRADVRLPALFGDNGVLQAQRTIPVWGWAAPGEKVTVTLDGGSATAVTDDVGRWQIWLPAHAAGGPFELMVTGRNTLRFKNILIGEVWICSGQSNMTFPLSKSSGGTAEVAQANMPKLRIYSVCRNVADTPLSENGGAWKTCSPASAAPFSATAYYFGKELQAALGVPVGLIHASWPGVPGESWTPAKALKTNPVFGPWLTEWKTQCDANAAANAAYERLFQTWRRQTEAAMVAGRTFPQQPDAPEVSPRHQYYPANCYNGMVAPLMPYAMRGVIWYQGEGNRDRAAQYRDLLSGLIAGWRGAWGQGDFPFGIVQLANFGEPAGHAGGTTAAIREAQRLAAVSTTNVGLIVTCDIGDVGDVHARNKRGVGQRLSLWAQGRVYDQPVESSGPLFAALAVKKGKALVRFTHVGDGLEVRDGGSLKGFFVAGADGLFVEATAAIAGDSVTLSAPDVPDPVAVDYAWADNPICNLYNRNGLPASPFRATVRPDAAGANR